MTSCDSIPRCSSCSSCIKIEFCSANGFVSGKLNQFILNYNLCRQGFEGVELAYTEVLPGKKYQKVLLKVMDKA